MSRQKGVFMKTNLEKGGETLQKAKNTRSRKYQLTINNPVEKGYTHEKIRAVLAENPPVYYCMCDETGENGTPHTHIYVCYRNAVYFSSMKKRFEGAHIETALGSSQENRDYIRKEGKYLNSEKKETNHIETFEEFGEMPLDKAAKNESVSEQVLQMIENGYSDYDIIHRFPSYGVKINHIEKMRQTILENENKTKWRDVKIHYIYGETGTGKTRSVMEKYGYENVYKITNYEHPFDGYKGELVIIFDEFRCGISFTDFLQYLDGYPCRLPARYADRIACYTEVYIISNISLRKQYPNIQLEQPQSWNALIRRITDITHYTRNDGEVTFFGDDTVIKEDEDPANYLL